MRLYVHCQGGGDGGRTTQGNGPSFRVSQCSEHQPCPGGSQGRKVGHGVGRNTAEERRSRFLPEPGIPESRTLLQGPQAEDARGHRVAGKAEELVLREVHDVVDIPHDGAHQPPVRSAVPAESSRCPVKRAVGEGGPTAVQGRSKGELGSNEFHPPGELEGPEEGRGQCHWMNRGADVVEVAWLHQFCSAGSAAHHRCGFEDLHGKPCPCHHCRGGQPIGPGAHHRYVRHRMLPSAGAWNPSGGAG